MAKAVSKELREKIISAYERGLGTIEKIANIFNLTPRTVARYLHLHRKGEDLNPGKPTGRIPILNEENLAIIKSLVLSNPDFTLQQYADLFKDKTGLEVTYVTIHNAFNLLNIRRKKRVFLLKSKRD